MKHLLSTARRHRLVALPIALAATVVAAVAGVASWTAAGHGSGTASTGALQTVTVAAFVGGDAPSSQLLPGGTADVILRVNNPNTYAVTLVSVSGNVSIMPDGSHSSCTKTGVTFTNQTSLSINVPTGSSLIDLSGAASMDSTSSTGCQGATFSIPVAITVHKG